MPGENACGCQTTLHLISTEYAVVLPGSQDIFTKASLTLTVQISRTVTENSSHACVTQMFKVKGNPQYTYTTTTAFEVQTLPSGVLWVIMEGSDEEIDILDENETGMYTNERDASVHESCIT